ncbi:universal stress protein [Acidisoma cellulosilytica]|uniref:Universal stress protein n=1 Tax=Acidisoma cellulosilyticum TaxID=2802395 RepID=A0A964E3L4_9PROT|nr:universal stress protein [Acidisoma cellulosilyticum]MCB8880785.1 universal stress protein [Acidisoma cellulosilyticum]
MPLRKVILLLNETAAGKAALDAALDTARLWQAHLTVLHVRVDARDVAPLAGEGLSGAMIEDMMVATEKESAVRAHDVRVLFEQAVNAHGVTIGEPRPGAGVATANFVSVAGREEEIIAQQARLADLTVIPHPEAGQDVSSSDALHAVLFDSGRPVLLAPAAAPKTIGRRICVGWNGTAESSSAVQAGIPWMKQAETVRILTSDDYQRRGPGAADLAAYLALHDIHAEVATFRPIDKSVGAGLIASAREFGADLLTMGAYSQSRLRQLILGGVTRHILENSDLPVLMSR